MKIKSKVILVGLGCVLASSLFASPIPDNVSGVSSTGGTGSSGQSGGSDDLKVVGGVVAIGALTYFGYHAYMSQLNNKSVVGAPIRKRYVKSGSKRYSNSVAHTHRANAMTKSRTHSHKYVNKNHTHRYSNKR